jgi:antitoxin Phd
MASWPVQDAKARFSELLNRCLAEGPQTVTRRGEEKAVLVPMEEWKRLRQPRYRNMKEWLLAPEARGDLEIPPLRLRMDPPVDFD